MRFFKTLAVFIILLISKSFGISWSNYKLQVHGKPMCKPGEKKTVELKIEKRENQVVLARKNGECNTEIEINVTLAESTITDRVIWARFYYFNAGYYTRRIPEECRPHIKKTDHYDCNIGEIDPNKITTPSARSPYIL
uniref:ZP domain-containing protein n=1 Tax=Strongyloides papillosus TaxID=174720 RepID=A0A0N5BGS4_STREA